MKQHLILFLAANPQGSDPRKLAEECAEIERELKIAPHRDDFRFESRWGVSIDDLMRHLTELAPTVIHFSGHGGGSAGLFLQDGQGQQQPVSGRALAMMVETTALNARVAVLNACYSTVQAEALRAKIECVVGMHGAIGDDAARAFAIRFYGALGNRRSIGNAVAQAIAALAAKRLPEEVMPRCLTRDGVDADRVVLGQPWLSAPAADRDIGPSPRLTIESTRAGVVVHGRGDRFLSSVVARFETLQTRQPHDLQRNVLAFFVEPLGSTQPPSSVAVDDSSLVSLSSFVSQAIADRAPCVLLADFGMGKSWFAQMTEYRIARDGLASSARPGPHPLLFNLRSFRRVVPPSAFWSRLPFFAAPDPVSLFFQVRDRAWSTAYGESRTRMDQEHLLQEFEAGRQVLLLDGLDEMQRGDAQSLLDEVSELSRSEYRSAIMITSRRSFFRDRAAEQRLSDLGFRVFYASPWSVRQVEEYLDKAHASGVLAARPVEVMARLAEVPGARDLTTRALLTAMLVAQWAEIGMHDHIDIPSLYKRHVEKALLQWQSARTQQLSIDQLQWYMEEFAMLMFQLDRRSISMREMTTYLSKKFSDIGLERFSMLGDSITQEIQANSLLLRHDDEYFFCHPSFCDFLVARLLLRSLERSDFAPFSVLHRSKQYRGIIEPFLIPMLPSGDLLDRLFAEAVVD